MENIGKRQCNGPKSSIFWIHCDLTGLFQRLQAPHGRHIYSALPHEAMLDWLRSYGNIEVCEFVWYHQVFYIISDIGFFNIFLLYLQHLHRFPIATSRSVENQGLAVHRWQGFVHFCSLVAWGAQGRRDRFRSRTPGLQHNNTGHGSRWCRWWFVMIYEYLWLIWSSIWCMIYLMICDEFAAVTGS